MRNCKNCRKQRDCNKRIGFVNKYGMMHFENLQNCSQHEFIEEENNIPWFKIYSDIAKKYGKYILRIIRTNMYLYIVTRNEFSNDVTLIDIKNDVKDILRNYNIMMNINVGVQGTEPSENEMIESVIIYKEE